jgi:hypothetical protein
MRSYNPKSFQIENTVSEKEDTQILGRFLTEEKQFSSIPSMLESNDQKLSLDLQTLSSNPKPSPRISSLQERLHNNKAVNKEETDLEAIKKKLEEEREAVTREWEQKVAEKERDHQQEIR